jgi:hypothetical protein
LAKPGEGTLDDLAARLDDEGRLALDPADDLDGNGRSVADARSLVAGIGEDAFDEGKAWPGRGDQQRTAYPLEDTLVLEPAKLVTDRAQGWKGVRQQHPRTA